MNSLNPVEYGQRVRSLSPSLVRSASQRVLSEGNVGILPAGMKTSYQIAGNYAGNVWNGGAYSQYSQAVGQNQAVTGTGMLAGNWMYQSQGNLVGNQRVMYQMQPVVKTEYVNVPVYETKYVTVPVVEQVQTKVEVAEKDDEELKKCWNACKEKEELILSLQTEKERLLQENKGFWLQMEGMRNELDDLNRDKVKRHGQGEQNRAMLDEIERLKQMLETKSQEFNGLLEEHRRMKGEHEKYVTELRNQMTEIQRNYETRITTIIKEKEGAQGGELRKVREQYEAEILSLKNRITEIQREYETRITTVIREKEGQGGAAKLQYEELIRTHKAKIDELLMKVSQYESRITVITQERNSFESRINAIMGERNSFEAQVREFQSRISQISAEYEMRITTITRERDEKYAVFMREKEQLSSEIYSIRQSFESKLLIITKERDGLLVKVRELEIIIERLRVELQEAKDNLIAYENKIAILSGELSRLKNLSSGKTTEIEEIRRRTLELESSSSGYQVRIAQYESQMSSLTIQWQNSLALVALLCAEIDGLRMRYVEKVGA